MKITYKYIGEKLTITFVKMFMLVFSGLWEDRLFVFYCFFWFLPWGLYKECLMRKSHTHKNIKDVKFCSWSTHIFITDLPSLRTSHYGKICSTQKIYQNLIFGKSQKHQKLEEDQNEYQREERGGWVRGESTHDTWKVGLASYFAALSYTLPSGNKIKEHQRDEERQCVLGKAFCTRSYEISS